MHKTVNPYIRFFALTILLGACHQEVLAASWTMLSNPAPHPAGTMILLTNGTVMVEQADTSLQWMRLVPDPQEGYVGGT